MSKDWIIRDSRVEIGRIVSEEGVGKDECGMMNDEFSTTKVYWKMKTPLRS